MDSEQVQQTFSGHTNENRKAASSPDGSPVVSGSSDNTISLWDADSRVEIMLLTKCSSRGSKHARFSQTKQTPNRPQPASVSSTEASNRRLRCIGVPFDDGVCSPAEQVPEPQPEAAALPDSYKKRKASSHRIGMAGVGL